MKNANCVRMASLIFRPNTSMTAGISGSMRLVMKPQAKNSSVTDTNAKVDPRLVVMNSPLNFSSLQRRHFHERRPRRQQSVAEWKDGGTHRRRIIGQCGARHG